MNHKIYKVSYKTFQDEDLEFEIVLEISKDRKIQRENFNKATFPFLRNHYLNYKLEYYDYNYLCNCYVEGNFVSSERLANIIWKEDKPKYYFITMKQVKEQCHGCRERIANQEGHMYPGGCLYDEEYS